MAVSPEFRQKIEVLYQSALAVEPAKRGRFLERACAGDESLRRQVEALLEAHEEASRIINSSATHKDAPENLAGKSQSFIGQLIGHYKILSFLGRGGMGEVTSPRTPDWGERSRLSSLPLLLVAMRNACGALSARHVQPRH